MFNEYDLDKKYSMLKHLGIVKTNLKNISNILSELDKSIDISTYNRFDHNTNNLILDFLF